MKFHKKTVVITGAAGGLGSALCQRFGEAGAHILALDIDETGLQHLQDLLDTKGVSHETCVCDVTDLGAAQKTLARQPGIDVLINNAGISHRSAFASTDLAVIRKVVDINFWGAVHCTQAVLPQLMQRRGQIIVISSVAGFSPLIARTGYAASKHALHGFFESLRSEIKTQGVDVMMVCPSFIATNIVRSALAGDGQPVQHDQVRVGGQMQPAEAAERIFRAAAARKRLLILGKTGKLAWYLHKIAPTFYESMMAKRLRAEMESVKS